MSSLSAMTRSFSVAFMRTILLPPGHVGAADALGLGRGDLASREVDVPGTSHVGPPFLALRTLRLADEAQRLVLSLHAGDGELNALGRWRYEQRVGHLVVAGRISRFLDELAAGEHEKGAVVALVVADEDRRDNEAAAEVVPALDGEIAVIILADKARGEGHVGVFLLARRLGLGLRQDGG